MVSVRILGRPVWAEVSGSECGTPSHKPSSHNWVKLQDPKDPSWNPNQVVCKCGGLLNSGTPLNGLVNVYWTYEETIHPLQSISTVSPSDHLYHAFIHETSNSWANSGQLSNWMSLELTPEHTPRQQGFFFHCHDGRLGAYIKKQYSQDGSDVGFLGWLGRTPGLCLLTRWPWASHLDSQSYSLHVRNEGSAPFQIQKSETRNAPKLQTFEHSHEIPYQPTWQVIVKAQMH